MLALRATPDRGAGDSSPIALVILLLPMLIAVPHSVGRHSASDVRRRICMRSTPYEHHARANKKSEVGCPDSRRGTRVCRANAASRESLRFASMARSTGRFEFARFLDSWLRAAASGHRVQQFTRSCVMLSMRFMLLIAVWCILLVLCWLWCWLPSSGCLLSRSASSALVCTPRSRFYEQS